MKKVVILHGTDGNPEANWFPWLKQKLEKRGYEVWAPQLPECHTPNRNTYNDFLFMSDWNLADNIVIGHSSGAVEVLNMLMDERCPRINMGVMVGAWKGGIPNGYEPGNTQFDNLFPPDGFDFEEIRNKADTLAFLHGDDDPHCPLDGAEWLAEQLKAPVTIVPNGGHLGAAYTELPELWRILESNL